MRQLFKQIPGIYIITNIINTKVYVGSSLNVSTRISSHKTALKYNRHCNIYLQKSYIKHGVNAFKYEVLEYCTAKDLISKEEFYHNLFKSNNKLYGYNIESFKQGRKFHSEETKIKIGNSNKGKRLGVRPSQKAIEFITWLGKQPKSENHRKRIANSHKNVKRQPFSIEWKRKMGQSHSFYWDLYDIYGYKVLENKSSKELSEYLNITSVSITYSYKKKHVIKENYIVVKYGDVFNENDYSFFNKNKIKNILRTKLGKQIIIVKENDIIEFNSIIECAEYLKIKSCRLSQSLKTGCKTKGYNIYYKN